MRQWSSRPGASAPIYSNVPLDPGTRVGPLLAAGEARLARGT